MDGFAVAGVSCGITALIVAGGFAGIFIKVGRVGQKIDSIAEWQPKCDAKLDATAERVARIEGILNGDKFPR